MQNLVPEMLAGAPGLTGGGKGGEAGGIGGGAIATVAIGAATGIDSRDGAGAESLKPSGGLGGGEMGAVDRMDGGSGGI